MGIFDFLFRKKNALSSSFSKDKGKEIGNLADLINQNVINHINKMEQLVGQSTVSKDMQYTRSQINQIVTGAVGKFEQAFSDGTGHSIGFTQPNKGNIMVSCWPCSLRELRNKFEQRVGYSYEQQFPHYMEQTSRSGCRFFLHLLLCSEGKQLGITACYCDINMEFLIRPTELVDD
jgi:hypothetical protein